MTYLAHERIKFNSGINMKEHLGDYRIGATGALLDEHEHVAMEFNQLVSTLSQQDYENIVDTNTEDDNCRSIQTICTHTVRSGYGYANKIRNKLKIKQTKKLEKQIESVQDVSNEITTMFEYLVETVQPLDQYTNTPWDLILDSSIGIVNMDLLLEHSICHIMRHRRQIEKFVLKLHEN